MPSVVLSVALLALAGCSSAAGSGPATAASGAASHSASAASAGYVLKPPSSIGGWTLVAAPSSATQQKMQQGLTQAEQTVGGVSGTPVYALYDDTQDQAWIVFVGVNGGGLDPQALLHAASAAPVATTDGIGDRLTTSWVPGVSGGPHGGQAQCQQTLIEQAGLSTLAASGLAATGAACYWMTSSTFGVVTIEPQANRSQWDFGWSGQQLDGFMLKVRAAVEQSA